MNQNPTTCWITETGEILMVEQPTVLQAEAQAAELNAAGFTAWVGVSI